MEVVGHNKSTDISATLRASLSHCTDLITDRYNHVTIQGGPKKEEVVVIWGRWLFPRDDPRVVFGDGGAISHPSPEFWVHSVLHPTHTSPHPTG